MRRLLLVGIAAAGMSTTAPKPDPRVGLKAGETDAGTAAWNLKLVSNTPASEHFAGVTNSDLTFYADYVIQGNYNGYQVWDISNPAKPTLETAFLCPASQSDVSVYKNLLFVSGEGLGGRVDCGTQGVQDTVSTERLRGIRIFDISDIANPKNLANVQTCRGSHTHTVVSDPNDTDNVYIYVSGSAPVRSPSELPGCISAPPDSNPEQRPVPHRGHQDSAGLAAGREDRELAADLRFTGGTGRATARPRKMSPRRPRPWPRPRPRVATRRWSTGRRWCCRSDSSTRCWTAW